jgi:hypothetical protein
VEKFGGIELVDGAFDGLGQQVELIQAAFVFVIMFIVDPAIGRVEMVEFFYAFVENGGVEEVFQYDVGVGMGGLVFFAQFGELGGPFIVIEYLGGGCHCLDFCLLRRKGRIFR